MTRALVYGDVDLNILDGSAVWLTATATAFADAGCEVTVVLKAPERTDRLTSVLHDHPGVEVVAAHADPRFEDVTTGPRLTPVGFLEVAARLDTAARFDLVVVRGAALAAAAAADDRVRGRLWTYLTDIPQHAATADDEAVAALAEVAAASRVLLCQTEDLRSLLEALVPDAVGRCELFPPVVPAAATAAPSTRDGGPLRLVYLGKFARTWRTREMCELPQLLAAHDVDARLTVIGDKFHAGDEVEPDFPERMRAALDASGVDWRGGMSRAEAMAIAAEQDVGMSWRGPELDASLELSTKVLEYGALGLPVVLNRTPAHERLLGTDYAAFANDRDEAVAALAALAADPELRDRCARRVAEVAADHSAERAADRVRRILARVLPSPGPRPAGAPSAGRPTRVVVAGHDLKFFTAIADHLAGLPDVELRIDAWASLHNHDLERSRELVAWADVVVCEWAGPNAAWYGAHKRDGQRLIVRLHRVELHSGLVDDLAIDAIDQVVCVSPHYAHLTRERTGWPADRIVVIPNAVDVEQLDRPKLPGAHRTLGMLGAWPHRKRLDLALDVLDQVRAVDPRFRLVVRSRLPWEQPWVWRDDDERRRAEELFERVRAAPRLRDGLILDGFGPDVGSWLRSVGHVLSTSDDESFHLSPAEGMASRAGALVRPWPGSETIYDERWILPDTTAMAERILADGDDPTAWAERGAAAHLAVREGFGLPAVLADWEELVVAGGRPDRDGACLMGPARRPDPADRP